MFTSIMVWRVILQNLCPVPQGTADSLRIHLQCSYIFLQGLSMFSSLSSVCLFFLFIYFFTVYSVVCRLVFAVLSVCKYTYIDI